MHKTHKININCKMIQQYFTVYTGNDPEEIPNLQQIHLYYIDILNHQNKPKKVYRLKGTSIPTFNVVKTSALHLINTDLEHTL